MPTATVDLAALSHNLARVRARLRPGTRVLAAVKADAYGHGAPEVARWLAACGVGWFGVATAAEALELRRAGVAGAVLVFGPVYEGLEALVAESVRLTVVDARSLEAARRAAARASLRARVHLKVDTGMGRLGLAGEAALALARRAARAPELELEGLWTHFACADEPDPTATLEQLERFGDLKQALARDALEIPLVHAANSAGVFAFPEAHFDLVRPGIALYGYSSSAVIAALEPTLLPVMTLSAPVTFVKRVAAGTPISYGALWRAPEACTVATVRIGYADGYPRAASGRAHVRIGEQRYPVAGRICMDQLMVALGSDATVTVGDRVTLFGPAGPSAEEVAEIAGTISYEVLTRIGARVARRYHNAR